MITCNIYVQLLLEMMIYISILLADNTFDGDWFESLHDEREAHEENMEICGMVLIAYQLLHSIKLFQQLIYLIQMIFSRYIIINFFTPSFSFA